MHDCGQVCCAVAHISGYTLDSCLLIHIHVTLHYSLTKANLLDFLPNLRDSEYATPMDIVKALLCDGWTWNVCITNAVCFYIARDGFSYLIDTTQVSWTTILELQADYGFYIGRRYRASLGAGADGFDSVH